MHGPLARAGHGEGGDEALIVFHGRAAPRVRPRGGP